MLKFLALFFMVVAVQGFCDNQTSDLSPISPSDELPFQITIVQSDFQLPSDDLGSSGLQDFAYAVYEGKWLLLAGRTNGLHGFNPSNNFPPLQQNTVVYVIDPNKKTIKSRSLLDPSSRLSQAHIDALSVTSSQYYQVNNTLYLIGGYGIDTASGQLSTKSTLTAIDIPGFMRWVDGKSSADKHIRQTSHPLLQVTGGRLLQADPHQPCLLAFGQNFIGEYTDNSNGVYTNQVRPFKIVDNGHKVYIQAAKQPPTDSNYRRRDLNVVPIVSKGRKSYNFSFLALSGVFTETNGVWTVPVFINSDGTSFMPNPSSPSTFKQSMNNYVCPFAGLFSKETNDMYIVLFGGLSYGFVDNGIFQTDPEIPFINQITTIRIDSHGNFRQFLMTSEYPTILSQFANPGNTLLFGASAKFIPADHLPTFPNTVFSLDKLGSSPVLLGYIVGGIQSSLPNTNSMSDSAASPYIFSVYIQRR